MCCNTTKLLLGAETPLTTPNGICFCLVPTAARPWTAFELPHLPIGLVLLCHLFRIRHQLWALALLSAACTFDSFADDGLPVGTTPVFMFTAKSA